MASRYRVGQRVKIIKHQTHYHGTITRIDPILSSNFKRAVGYWFVIKYADTVPYFCVKGESGLFTNRDIMPA